MPAEQGGLKDDVGVSMFTSLDENPTRVGSSMLRRCEDDAASTLRPQVHNHSLAYDNGFDLITILSNVIVEEVKSHAYPYAFL